MRKERVGGRRGLAAALAMVVAALGCREPAEVRRTTDLRSSTASTEVTTSTTGSSLDSNGYTIVLDDTITRPIGINETVRLTGLTEGVHKAELTGVAHDCTVADPNPVRFWVATTFSSSIAFSVSCGRPPTGDLRVQTYTTGAGIPPDYQLDISGPGFLRNERIGPNVTVPFDGISSGDYTVTLAVPANCTVSGANPSTVTIPAGSIRQTAFSVRCIGNGNGHLSVTTSTAGTDTAPDYGPEPYSFEISAPGFFWDGRLGRNATVPLSGIPSGDYTVWLGVPPNCPVSGANPRTVTVPAGGTAGTTFVMNCWTRGVLFVSTSTTGTGIPATYSLEISGPRRLRMSIEPNIYPGTLYFVIPVGGYTVALGVPANCTVSGANPRTVPVPVPDGTSTTTTTFSVTCTAGT